jgi:DNA modification methylase
MSSYPININEIREKVSLRKVRNKYIESKQILLDFTIQITNVKDEVNRFGEKVTRVDGEIPIYLPVKNEDRFLFISYDQSILTHGLHKYPAKFFPELPRWLIKRYSNEYDTILDPFCGSGTTNVEALLNKRHSVGIDVDPFSRYLSRVKTTPLNENELDDSCSILLKEIIDFKPSLVKAEILNFPYRDQWFNEEIVLELAYIKEKIGNLDFGEDVKDFYRICFSSIIRSVSNADDNCTRTVIRKKLNKQVYPADALTKFVKSILIKVPKMKEFSKKYPKDIRVAFPEDNDARKILYPDNSFDLAVTSPPYANAVDYPRTHQLEIYWLELANGSLTPLKRKHVGTESVKVEVYKNLHNLGILEADEAIYNIYQKDPRRAYIGYKYLYDMQENLKEVYRVLKPEGRYIIVVGNNKIREEVFKNWLYIMKMSEQIGFKLESFFASEIIKHFIKVPREERIDTDWILVLQK